MQVKANQKSIKNNIFFLLNIIKIKLMFICYYKLKIFERKGLGIMQL